MDNWTAYMQFVLNLLLQPSYIMRCLLLYQTVDECQAANIFKKKLNTKRAFGKLT